MVETHNRNKRSKSASGGPHPALMLARKGERAYTFTKINLYF